MHLTSWENPTRYQIMTCIKSFQLGEYVIGQQVNMEGQLIWKEEESIHKTNQGQCGVTLDDRRVAGEKFLTVSSSETQLSERKVA